MQFHLEADERKLLADILLQADPQKYNEIFTKVMAHDLRFDAGELEETGELLAGEKRNLKDEIARQTDAAMKAKLEGKLALLQRVLDRVNEACVMF